MNVDSASATTASRPSVSPGYVVGPAFRRPWQEFVLKKFAPEYSYVQFSGESAWSKTLAVSLLGVRAQGKPNVEAKDVRQELVDGFAGKFKQTPDDSLRPAAHFDDAWYYLPTLDEITTVFKARTSRGWSDGTEILDCEDFAYWLKKDFIVHRYTTFDPARDKPIPFAVGMIWGDLGTANAHTANVAVTFDAGLQIMDATPNYGEKPYPAKDWTRLIDYIVI